jgi:hypothetical protein
MGEEIKQKKIEKLERIKLNENILEEVKFDTNDEKYEKENFGRGSKYYASFTIIS